MRSCGSTLQRPWTACQRPAVFPDSKCHLHTVHLDGSTSSRNAQLREVIRAGLRALSVQVTDAKAKREAK